MDRGALLSGIAHRRAPPTTPQLQALTDNDERAHGGCHYMAKIYEP